MAYAIIEARQNDLFALSCIWEASARMFQNYLSETELETRRNEILESNFKDLTLRVYKIEEEIVGFIGVQSGCLVKHYMSPKYHGRGIGKALLAYAIGELGVVDIRVDEKNKTAIDFYLCHGFREKPRTDAERYADEEAGILYLTFAG